MGEMIKLKDAVGNYSPEKGIYSSYNTYRKHAKESGSIFIGNKSIPVHKEKGTWWINKDDFDLVVNTIITNRKNEEKAREFTTEQYKKGIFRPGIVYLSDYFYYDNKGDFRLEVDVIRQYRKKSDGVWYCNTCNKPAETEHNNPECHVCADWGGCGKDCTLSRVFCPRCGKSLDIK